MPNGDFLSLYSTGFDVQTNRPSYARHRILAAVGNKINWQSVAHGSFRQGNNYPHGKVNQIYEIATANQVIKPILGANKFNLFFDSSAAQGNSWLSRGHLAPLADFPFASQRDATMYFFNVNPQFQGFNLMNWGKLLENSIRLANLGPDVIIHTGTANSLRLPDTNEIQRDIILSYASNRIVVPNFFYKAILTNNVTTHFFIGGNHPNKNFNAEHLTAQYLNVCTDICGQRQYIWITMAASVRRDIARGILLCCDLTRPINLPPNILSLVNL